MQSAVDLVILSAWGDYQLQRIVVGLDQVVPDIEILCTQLVPGFGAGRYVLGKIAKQYVVSRVAGAFAAQFADTVASNPRRHLRAAVLHRVCQMISAQIDPGIVEVDDSDQPQLIQSIPRVGNSHEALRSKGAVRDGKILDDVCKGLRAFHDRS